MDHLFERHRFLLTDAKSLPSPYLWFKTDSVFQDTNQTVPAVADNDPVALIANQGIGPSNFNPSVGTAGARPLLKTNVQNGQSVLRFDGVDDNLSVFFTPFLAPIYIFAVVSRPTVANGASIIDGGNGASPGFFFSYSATSTLDFLQGTMTAGTLSAGFHTIMGSYTPTPRVRLDKQAPVVSTSGAGSNVLGIVLGTDSQLGLLGFSGFDFGELMVFRSNLTLGQESQVLAYLRTKFGTP